MREVDTLIIGSGIAAAAISNRLLEADSKACILILEAGQKVKMQDAALWEEYLIKGNLPYTKYMDLGYPKGLADAHEEGQSKSENVSTGPDEIPLQGSRVMTYGGSTITWGGWSFRLKPEDFQLKTNTGKGIDWPLDYEELESYYCQAEHYIGVSGDSSDQTPPRTAHYPFPEFPYTLEDQPVAKAMTSLEIQHSHLPIARHGITDTTSKHAPCKTTGTCKYCPFGARYATTNFLNDMTEWGNFPNFETKDNCVVETITMDSKSKATGVTYYDKVAQTSMSVGANKIIVAGGTIESAKLLLRSISSFWPTGIGNDHDLVGRNIITHPYYVFETTLKDNPLKLQPEMNFPTLCTRHFDSPKEQKNKGKFLLLHSPSSPGVRIAQQMQAGKKREDINKYVAGQGAPLNVQIHGMVEIVSEHKNYVKNWNKINHIGLKETEVHFTKPEGIHDHITVDIAGKINNIFEEMGANPMSGPPFNPVFISWRADHIACTCRMSANETEGVTDKNMKIHGVDNLYVCSNGAFSSLGTVNPTLTLTALSLRLGDHLKNN